MVLILAAIGVLLAGGLGALVARQERGAALVGRGAVYVATGLGGAGLALAWTGDLPASLSWPWPVPAGAFAVAVDGLSAWFLVPALVLAPLAAACGGAHHAGASSHGDASPGHAATRAAGVPWFFFDTLLATILLVLVARNAILFLVAWETMALASFFLVIQDDGRAEVRRSGWIYLVATHLGTAFLLALFALLGRATGSMDFDVWAAADATAIAAPCFLLAVVGFGTKAGFMPLHVWLPEAHPAAPSHVSAIMSAVMIKTGIYGLLRSFEFLGAPAPWWGWVLLGLGLLSAVGGIAFALAQHDLKRLLAYSSIENMGIVAIGAGLGVLGLAAGDGTLAGLGFAGAFVHVWNHAAAKGLLFLGAGSILHAAGTLDVNRLGGLLRRMRGTGAGVLVGAMTIAGIPPLSGFVGEFVILVAAFRATASSSAPIMLPGVSVLAGLAFVSGLAVATYTKVIGIGLLGEPRSESAAAAREAPRAVVISIVALAVACVAGGFAWTGPVQLLLAPGVSGGPLPLPDPGDAAAALSRTWYVPLAGVLLAAAVGLLVRLRHVLLRGRIVRESLTWDCGYARPTPRMQYSGSSFVSPLTGLIQPVLRIRSRGEPPRGIFPDAASISTETPALFRESLYEPAFHRLRSLLGRLRRIQHGRLQLYVLYVVLTLILLLLWQLRGAR